LPFPLKPSSLRLPAFLFALLIGLLLATSAAAEDDFPAPVRVGGDLDYPPYEFLDEAGRPSGYNVELTRAIAEVMGMEVEIRLMPWGEARAQLASGELDILQGMAYTRERTAEVDFTLPHTLVYQSVWTRTDEPPIRSLDELEGRDVLLMRGSVMHDYMLQQGPKANLILTDSLADALTLLASGRHDAALAAKLPGQYLVNRLNLTGIAPSAQPVLEQPYGFAVRKGNRSLPGRFNEGLALLKESGELERIRARWLGVLEKPERSWLRILRYSLFISLPLLIVLSLTLLWSRTLQKRVAERTLELQAEVAERRRAMEELEIRQKQLIQADKMTSLGILVSGVAHEVNNPNGLILLNLPLLQKAWTDALPVLEDRCRERGDFRLGWLRYSRMKQELPLLLEETLEAARRIKRIVEDLKGFARQEDSELLRPADLNDIARAAVRLVDASIRKATERFEASYAQGLPPVPCLPQRIEQVLVNLLLNACQALPERSRAIRLETGWDEAAGMVRLHLEDEGAGVEPEQLPHLCSPFFTTRRETGGTGLGLSISESIVKKHGGTLEFDSAPGKGMRVRLSLPAAKED